MSELPCVSGTVVVFPAFDGKQKEANHSRGLMGPLFGQTPPLSRAPVASRVASATPGEPCRSFNSFACRRNSRGSGKICREVFFPFGHQTAGSQPPEFWWRWHIHCLVDELRVLRLLDANAEPSCPSAKRARHIPRAQAAEQLEKEMTGMLATAVDRFQGIRP